MVTLVGRVPLEEINTQARQVEFGRVLLTVIAAVLFGVGWLAGKTFSLLWLGLAWSVVAVKVGWKQGRAGTRGPA
jgi:hypothetical protein